MALVEIPMSMNNLRYPVLSTARLSLRERSEIVEEGQVELETTSSPDLDEDILFVAVGKDEKESDMLLKWALGNLDGKRICIIHVHQPAQKIPTPFGTKFSISQMGEHQVKAYHEIERQDMHEILDKYILTCEHAGARVEKLCLESDSVEKGILKFIIEHEIKWLVMGTTSFSRTTKKPKSKKANFVRLEAPFFCHVQFICKGNLIYTRESQFSDAVTVKAESPSSQPSPDTETMFSKSHSVAGEIVRSKSLISLPFHRRFRSDNNAIQRVAAINGPSRESSIILKPEGSRDVDSPSRTSPSVASQFSTYSFSETNEDMGLLLPSMSEEPETYFEPHLDLQSNETVEGTPNNKLYDRLEQVVVEAESSKREVYVESMKCKKAEKGAIDVISRAKVSETTYSEGLRRHREIEEMLARSREDHQKMKYELDEILEELRVSQEQQSILQCQLIHSDKMVEELEQKMFSAVELLQKYKFERDELMTERNDALALAEELKKKQADEASSSSVSQLYSEFSFLEIKEATKKFSNDLKIGEGGYGSIYRGDLHHLSVAIKVLNPGSLQGPSEFQQEVNTLSRLRHPNLITLIGACPEAWALIYEYLPNGSLEDRLNCKDNTPPLSWQTRIRIAAELCSVLIFLHSCHPEGIVHADLKPANILLDANYVSKLSDFGICRLLSQDAFSEKNPTKCWRTEPKGSAMYIDPNFLATGELTSKSDVYAFGIILLRLLTGRSASGIAREVQYALDKGNLKDLLDPTAGDWPFVQAKQLAHLALRCSDLKRENRPRLASEVWRVLESMRVSCGVSPSQFGSYEKRQPPAYFVCPIFQEMMQDPVVAADGFTYEAEAIKGWLDSDHDTSPMTNLKLVHSNLIPNHALRSAIQEWLQQK